MNSNSRSSPDRDTVKASLSGYDEIGPAHPVSNLRQMRYLIPANESELHRKYRLLREETWHWSNEFWAKHNTEFAEVNNAITQLLK